mgnify:CR=1 FL=1
MLSEHVLEQALVDWVANALALLGKGLLLHGFGLGCVHIEGR